MTAKLIVLGLFAAFTAFAALQMTTDRDLFVDGPAIPSDTAGQIAFAPAG